PSVRSSSPLWSSGRSDGPKAPPSNDLLHRLDIQHHFESETAMPPSRNGVSGRLLSLSQPFSAFLSPSPFHQPAEDVARCVGGILERLFGGAGGTLFPLELLGLFGGVERVGFVDELFGNLGRRFGVAFVYLFVILFLIERLFRFLQVVGLSFVFVITGRR